MRKQLKQKSKKIFFSLFGIGITFDIRFVKLIKTTNEKNYNITAFYYSFLFSR